MASFEDLIKSKRFLWLFVSSGVFRSLKAFNIDKAEDLWAGRNPYLEWNICSECNDLAYHDNLCGKHYLGEYGRMASWRWANGDLYRYIDDRQSYVKWKNHVAGQEVGRCNTVVPINGNPFDLRPENLAVMLKITECLIRGKHIPMSFCGQFESAIKPFVRDYLHYNLGNKRFIWSYGINDIAKAMGVTRRGVDKMISRGELDPSSLESIIRYSINTVRSA